jgi:hypothetical protein
MATSIGGGGNFGKKTPVINQAGSNIVNNTTNPRIPPSANGTRIEPKDSYIFIASSKAIFKATFTDTDKPIQVDTGTAPTAVIYQSGHPIVSVTGSLVAGQLYEYQFEWDVPAEISVNGATYSISYTGFLGGVEYNWGNEFFRIQRGPSNVKLKVQAYATVDELRMDKFNIDSYLPETLSKDKAARDHLLHQQLVSASKWLNGQLNLRDFHSSYNDNFNQFVRYYALWSILGQSLGEEGSAVSDRSLRFWEDKWKAVLKQIKMHSQLSNIPTGRA